MFLKSNAKKIPAKLYLRCSRDTQQQIYLSLSPAIYTLLLKNFVRQETAEEVLVRVFIELFNNIDDSRTAEEVKSLAYQIASRFIA